MQSARTMLVARSMATVPPNTNPAIPELKEAETSEFIMSFDEMMIYLMLVT